MYTSSTDREIHASGHAMSEELKLMIRLMNPKYLMPIHGEYRMLKKHAHLAKECGIKKDNIFVLDNGDVLEMYKGNITKVGNFEVTETFVDGNRIGDISGAVLNDTGIEMESYWRYRKKQLENRYFEHIYYTYNREDFRENR